MTGHDLQHYCIIISTSNGLSVSVSPLTAVSPWWTNTKSSVYNIILLRVKSIEGSDPHFHRASHCCCSNSLMVSINHERSHQTVYESSDRRLEMWTSGGALSVCARRSMLSRFTLPKTLCQTNEDARRLEDLKLSNSLRYPHLIGNQTCLFNIHLIGRWVSVCI